MCGLFIVTFVFIEDIFNRFLIGSFFDNELEIFIEWNFIKNSRVILIPLYYFLSYFCGKQNQNILNLASFLLLCGLMILQSREKSITSSIPVTLHIMFLILTRAYSICTKRFLRLLPWNRGCTVHTYKNVFMSGIM